MKELPKEIFVNLVEEDGENSWLSAYEDPADHADQVEDKICGRYELQEMVKISSQVQVDSI